MRERIVRIAGRTPHFHFAFIRLVRVAEIWRHHADDRVRIGIHAYVAAEHIRIAAEFTLPNAVADHDWIAESFLRILRSVDAPDCRLRAEKLEIFRAGGHQLDAIRMIAADERRADRPEHADLIEHAGAIAQIVKFRYGHAGVFRVRAIEIVKYADELFRMLKWKRTQQHCIDDGKNGGIRADAERQRKYGDNREPAAAPKRSQRVLQSSINYPRCSPAFPTPNSIFRKSHDGSGASALPCGLPIC